MENNGVHGNLYQIICDSAIEKNKTLLYLGNTHLAAHKHYLYGCGEG